MFDYDLAGAVGPGTTTLTRKATLVRSGPPRTGGGGGGNGVGSFPSSPTQQDQALEWSQRQQPTLGSRPHTRMGHVPGLALHGAVVASVLNRPATRSTGLPMLVLQCLSCPPFATSRPERDMHSRAHTCTRDQRVKAIAVGNSRTCGSEAHRCSIFA